MNGTTGEISINPNNNINFCSPAFTLNNPSQKSLLNDNWYFAITPFPRNPYGVKLSNIPYKDLYHENELNNELLQDVFYPFNDQNFDKIPIPRFSVHSFILMIELSSTTKPFVSTIFQVLKEYFSQQRPIYFTVLIIYKNTIKFPVIQKNSKTVSISTWSDFSESFEFQYDSMYFNMNENKGFELFTRYLSSIENTQIENDYPTVDIFDILHSLFPFCKSLRNPLWIVASDLYISQDSPLKKVEETSDLFFQSSLSAEFYFLMKNPINTVIKNNQSLQLFTAKCNCPVQYFGSSQFEKISIDLIYNFSKPRSIFNRVKIFTSESLEVSKIYGRGCRVDSDQFKTSVLTVNDTFHIFIKADPKKLQSEKPKIVVRTRYVDGSANCFHRFIPFDCSSRKTFPESILAAAAAKIINEKYDVNDAINELFQLDVAVTNKVDYFSPNLYRKRFNFAVKSLALIRSDLWICNFVSGNSPRNIFEFLSPVCCQVTKVAPSENLNSYSAENSNVSEFSLGEWKIAPEVVFGSDLILVWLYENQFVFVESDSNGEKVTKSEAEKIIENVTKKGFFEIVDFKDFFENQQLVRVDLLSKNYLLCQK